MPDEQFDERCSLDLKEMQSVQGKILDRLTRIETILADWADFEKRLREIEITQARSRDHMIDEHGQRILSLEMFRADIKGKTSIISPTVGAAISIVCAVIAGLILWSIKH